MEQKDQYFKIYNALADEINHLVQVHLTAEKIYFESEQSPHETYDTLSQYICRELDIEIERLHHLRARI